MITLPSFISPIQYGHHQLRIIAMEDASYLHSLINDWNVVRMLSNITFPYPKKLLHQWIETMLYEAQTGKSYYFSIVHTNGSTEEIKGCIGIKINQADKSGKIGYWVGQKYWGKAIATQAVERLSSWALANLDINYIHATSADDNLPSISVLKKCGYQPFGQGKEKFLARNEELPVSYFLLKREDICPSRSVVNTRKNTTEPKKLLLVVAAALIDTEGKLLLARRPEGKSMAGMWEFPGGKVETGETPEAALIRELKEELNIDVTQSCLSPFTFASYDYPNFHLLMPLYLCHRWKNYPEPKENQQLDWVSADQLKNYLVMEADKPFIPLLKDLLF